MGLDDRRDLRRLALRTLLAGVPGAQRRPTGRPAWSPRGSAGYALFGYNIVDPAQVAALTASCARPAPDVLIAIDEEGGDVTRLGHATGSPYPGNAALGAVDDLDLTRARLRARSAPNWPRSASPSTWRPTVDVNTADDNPVIGTRSFGADPRRVAAHAAAAVTGLQEAGVAACAKHFPGPRRHRHRLAPRTAHRRRARRSCCASGSCRRSPAAIAAGVRAIMTAHIRVPALTGDLPATFSPAALVDLLRSELGFTGAVVTDALEMQGRRGAIGVPGGRRPRPGRRQRPALHRRRHRPSRLVGAAEIVEATVAAIVDAVRLGRLTADRLEEAAARNARSPRRRRQRRRRGAPHRPRATPPPGARSASRARLPAWPAPLVVQLRAGRHHRRGRGAVGPGPAPAARPSCSPSTAGDRRGRRALAARAGGRPIVVVGRRHPPPPVGARRWSSAGRRPPGGRAGRDGLAGRLAPGRGGGFVTTYGASHANGRAAAARGARTPRPQGRSRPLPVCTTGPTVAWRSQVAISPARGRSDG